MIKISQKIIGIFISVFIIFNGWINRIEVKASATDNVSGFAWSENIGWISFNCTNTSCASSDFGVSLAGTGELSGHAWSEGIGWISFDKSETGTPPGAPYNNGSQTYIAKRVGNNFTGWARALSYGDGWDGWIKLKKDPADSGADYGVTLSGINFMGYAWGSDVVGWVSFSSANCDADTNNFIDVACGGDNATTAVTVYGVSFNNLPVMNSVVIAPDPAYASTPSLSAVVDATDADSDPITYSYQWKKGGVNISGQTSATLSFVHYIDNDVITVQVTPNDGNQNGNSMTSAGVTIGASNSSDVPARGWAWSDNIGWISFNCVNTAACDASNYYVNFNLGTRTLSGYAWNESIGWISFNVGDVAGCPAGTCQPRLDGNAFKGWARALANNADWDGWISLNCANSNTCGVSNFNVTLDTDNNFIGYAWGGDVPGWIQFNPAFGGVYLANYPPEATNLSVDIESYLCAATPAYQFSWTFSDNGDTESQFQIQIDDSNSVDGDGNFLTPVIDRTISSLTNPSGTVNTQLPALTSVGATDKLAYNTTYYWHVQVWDSNAATSGWTDPAVLTFNTPQHRYPVAGIACTPACPADGHALAKIIQFNDDSVCYGISNTPLASCASWLWDFGDDKNLDSTLENPTYQYTESGSYPLTMQVTDADGNMCSASQAIDIDTSARPKWKEVLPKQ